MKARKTIIIIMVMAITVSCRKKEYNNEKQSDVNKDVSIWFGDKNPDYHYCIYFKGDTLIINHLGQSHASAPSCPNDFINWKGGK
jgi:hypothetical protein